MVLTRNYPVVIGAGVAVLLFGRILSRTTAPAFAVGARVRVNGHALERG